MTEDQLRSLRHWFAGFVREFRDDSGRLPYLLQVKHGHSARVAVEARGIAADLGWDSGLVYTAEALGWLHDTGRFPQFQEFKTLYDPVSVDHSQRGYEVLIERQPLARVDPDDARHILDGVRYHGRKTIPAEVAADSLPFVHIIRDADKLDIMRVLNAAIRDGSIYERKELMFNIDLKGPPSPGLVHKLRTVHAGSYEDIRSMADFNLLQMAWVYDIRYRPTLQRIAERRLLDRIREVIPRDAGVDAVFAEAVAHMVDRLGCEPAAWAKG